MLKTRLIQSSATIKQIMLIVGDNNYYSFLKTDGCEKATSSDEVTSSWIIDRLACDVIDDLIPAFIAVISPRP